MPSAEPQTPWVDAGEAIVRMLDIGDYFWVTLHSRNPTDANSFELDYEGYERWPIKRSREGWDVRNGIASNAKQITFGNCLSGDQIAVYFGLYASATGGKPVFVGLINGGLRITTGITPAFLPGAMIIAAEGEF